MAGALKTLYGALRNSAYMSGVELVFGEEEVHSTAHVLPMVSMVPTGGPIDNDPGYVSGLDPTVERVWGITESVELYLWAEDVSPLATPIDHADQVESLRQLVLSALQDQRVQFDSQGTAMNGLWFKAVNERWELMKGGYTRMGRALVLTVTAEISVPMAIPPYATVTSETINKTITAGP